MGTVSRQSAVAVLWAAVFLVVPGFVPVAQAKIYKYRDKWGMTHVVDSPGKVPPEYQDQVKSEAGSPAPAYQLQQPSAPIVPAQSGSPAGRPAAGGPAGGSDAAGDARKKRCEREIGEQTARISELRKKADAWTDEEMNRNCGDASRTKEGGCYYITARGGMREMLENQRKETEAKNPYRKQAADAELRLKKLEGECR